MIPRTLHPYLQDLERRIDPAQEERLLDEWAAFSAGRLDDPIFSPRRAAPCPPGLDWPKVSINSALDNFEQMALQQYRAVSETLHGASGLLLNVRANYGSSILPSLFGVEPFIMDEALDTLPTSRPLNDLDAIRRLLDAPPPDLRTGWGAKVLAMGEMYAEIASVYPAIGRHVFIYHPDCQSAMDACEVIWGSTLFYALYDQPELVHALLERITETYIRLMRAWEAIVPFHPAGNAHWGLYHRGAIMLRDDSAMNLSPAMFDAFISPYDQRMLDVFGGGAIHFCGKGDHFIERLTRLRGLHAVNLSQPELNNMETIFTCTIDRQIPLIGLRRDAAEAALNRGRSLRGLVHCFE